MFINRLSLALVFIIAATARADEPRVKAFGSKSLKAAAKYLEVGAVSWVRERSCVNCHTTGPCMTEYTAWSRQFGQPSEEVHTNFVNAVPKKVQEVKETDKVAHRKLHGF